MRDEHPHTFPFGRRAAVALAAFAVALSAMIAPQAAIGAPEPTPEIASAEQNARFILETSSASQRASLVQEARSLGLHARASGQLKRSLVVSGRETAALGFVTLLVRDGRVVSVERDNRLAMTAAPNDERLAEQWGLSAMRLPAAWDKQAAASGQSIAIIDTGVDLSHPDLMAAVDTVNDWDFVDDDGNASDLNGHGTGVAGSAAGVADNRIGIAGTGAGARILPLRALDEEGSGWESDVADAVRYAADHDADVINLSLGGPRFSQYLVDAIGYARTRGCTIVAAAGNNGDTAPFYPASYSGVIGVAAVDGHSSRPEFSSMGAQVDVAAPGVGIIRTSLGGGYGYSSGTSEASPYVAGLCALLRAQQPSLTPDKVASILQNTCRDLGTYGRDDLHGWGLVDAASMLAFRDDTQAPVTRAAGIPDGWSGQDVQVTFEAADSGTGVRASYYSENEEAAIRFSQPLIVRREGVTKLEFWSKDRAGNVEAKSTALVRIDRTAPSSDATLLAGAGYTTVHVSATDGGSGVAKTMLRLDGGNWTDAEKVIVETSGNHVAEYRSVDSAGNAEQIRAIGFTVERGRGDGTPSTEADRTPPVTIAVGVPDGWTSSSTTVTLVAADATTQVAETWYRIGFEPKRRYVGPLRISTGGITRISFYSTDAHGNQEAEHSAYVRIDRTRPQTPPAPVWTHIDTMSANLAWSPGVDQDSGVERYRLHVDGRPVKETARTSARLYDISPGSTHSVQIVAIDAAGNESALGAPLSLRLPSAEQRIPVPQDRAVLVSAETSIAGANSPPVQIHLSDVHEAGELVWLESGFPASAPPGVRFIGRCMNVTLPAEATLNSLLVPIDVRLSEARRPSLAVYRWDGSSWHKVVSIVDMSERRVVAITSIDGSFALGEPSAQARTNLRATTLLKPAYGASATIKANLLDHFATLLRGRSLVLERLSGGSWKRIATVEGGGTGTYSARVSPINRARTRFRLRFPATTFENASSVEIVVLPKAQMSRPSVRSATSPRTIVVEGSLKPAHKGSVSLELWFAHQGEWVKWKAVKAAVSSSGRYRAAVKADRAVCRVRAVHSDFGHASSASPFSASITIR